MTIRRMRELAVWHAEQAANYSAAASGLGQCQAAEEFREKADFHRVSAEDLSALAQSLQHLVHQLTES